MTPSKEVTCLLVPLPPSHQTNKFKFSLFYSTEKFGRASMCSLSVQWSSQGFQSLGGFLIQVIRMADFAFPSYTILKLVCTSRPVSEQTLYVLKCEFHLIIDLLLKTSSFSLSHISWLVCQIRGQQSLWKTWDYCPNNDKLSLRAGKESCLT